MVRWLLLVALGGCDYSPSPATSPTDDSTTRALGASPNVVTVAP